MEHDIITRDAYSVSGAEIWEFSKSQRETDILNFRSMLPWLTELWPRHCPCSRSQPLLNMNIDGNFDATLWRHRWRNHREKLFWHNFGRSFHIWGKIEAMFNISKFSKWPPFWARDKIFFLEDIPEVKYAIKIAISISDILNFRSTL